jgi:uncharacterized membrane protein
LATPSAPAEALELMRDSEVPKTVDVSDMSPRRLLRPGGPVAVRVVAAAVVGAATAIWVGAAFGWWYAPAAGWTCAATTYLVWTWAIVLPLDADGTASHAKREDPTRAMTDLLLVASSIASLVGVGYLLSAGGRPGVGRDTAAALGVANVMSAWLLVHTVYTLRYATLYFAQTSPPIDFGPEGAPDYRDFAYLSFTLGMTYQVSDTTLQTAQVRATALRHALLSYLLGAVVLATTINLVVQLASTRR